MLMARACLPAALCLKNGLFERGGRTLRAGRLPAGTRGPHRRSPLTRHARVPEVTPQMKVDGHGVLGAAQEPQVVEGLVLDAGDRRDALLAAGAVEEGEEGLPVSTPSSRRSSARASILVTAVVPPQSSTTCGSETLSSAAKELVVAPLGAPA